jgi:hypothetical protein
MSPLHFVIMLIIAIIILTVLTLKFKMHPVMVLFLTATFCGLASGKTLVDTFSSITKYFGSTLGSIGVMIIFGAVIASGINDTGAATSMVNFFIKKFKGKCLELAPALTGFIMSIPVFGDIAIILNAPISAILAKRKKLGMQQVAPFVNLGLTLTVWCLPPPASWQWPSCWALTSAPSSSSASSAPSSPLPSATSACAPSTPRASMLLRCPSTPRASRLWRTPTTSTPCSSKRTTPPAPALPSCPCCCPLS